MEPENANPDDAMPQRLSPRVKAWKPRVEVNRPLCARDSAIHYWAPRHSGERALQPLSAQVRHLPFAPTGNGRLNTQGVGIHPDDGAL